MLFNLALSNLKFKGYKMNSLYRVKDAAKYLGVGISTVWLYAKQKKLHPIKLSDRVTVFSKEDLDSFINNAMAA